METLRPNRKSAADEMENLDEQLAQAIHDINNPLAVISGNTQLLTELSETMSLDPIVVKSLEDIHEAVIMLNERLSRLGHLREELRGYLQ